LRVHARKRIWLLKERMRRLVRRREKHDAAVGFPDETDAGDAVNGGRHGGGRCGPNEKNGFDAAQSGVERFGSGEVAADDFNVRRKIGGFGMASKRSDVKIGRQLSDDLASDSAGGADDEDAFHAGNYSWAR
jgi:hypothetical protein